MAKKEKERLVNFLYHLGKGLWKSVPILGPIVEEVVFAQFEYELKQRVSNLNEDQVQSILKNIPNIDVDKLDNQLSQISEDVKLYSINIMTNVISKLEESHKDFLEHVRLIERNVEPIPDIMKIVNELKEKAGDRDAIIMALNEIHLKRDNWVERISRNQKKLLSKIGESPISLDRLWGITKEIIPDCGYKEFRFRLHELEWLALVRRHWSQSDESWMYRLTQDGKRLANSFEEST